MANLQQTPAAQRLHIAFFGRRNSGKSSLINALAGQQVSIVSDVPGTTTDPVYKSIELLGLGPCTLVDTAGFDDVDTLGQMRVEKTLQAAKRADLCVLVVSTQTDTLDLETTFLQKIENKPVICLLNKVEFCLDLQVCLSNIEKALHLPALAVSAKTGQGMDKLLSFIRTHAPQQEERSIVGNLAGAGDTVVLVMPQDASAPKGRLILPQVQTLRELLDRGAIATCVTTEQLPAALAAMKQPPKAVITDSQVFGFVAEHTPKESILTSFSILMANYKGDIELFTAGAKAIAGLKAGDTVLIAEACSHTTTDADIARVKIPGLLHKKIDAGIQTVVVSGTDFPDDLSPYALVIHCGGCMFNRAHVMSRAQACQAQGVPVTNYGVAIAYLTGILDKIALHNQSTVVPHEKL